MVVFAVSSAFAWQGPPAASIAAKLPIHVPDSNNTLLDVKRIYVAELKGGAEAESLRELIIASIDSTKLFVMTDNPERADAILKGAADDHAFTNTFDSDESISGRESGGKGGSGGGLSSKSGGLYAGIGASDNESHHIKERKHEAYASVRLCNLDGDVLWSTTQESTGAKFRGASADVALKIAHQLSIDIDRARRNGTTAPVRNSNGGDPK
ncbi:MAG: hypothetical protein JO051_13075 [Acidobacteriaceae bacterium]|nr:hypothetical protein [Acidobacteriaceae bacterium]